MISPFTASFASIIPGKARMRGLRGSSAHNETEKVTEKSHICRHLPGKESTQDHQEPSLTRVDS